MELEERWFLCYEAEKMIRYNVKWPIWDGIGNPEFHEFKYITDWRDTYLSFKCFQEPDLYVRIGRSDPCNVITITLVGSDWELQEISSTTKINLAAASS